MFNSSIFKAFYSFQNKLYGRFGRIEVNPTAHSDNFQRLFGCFCHQNGFRGLVT